jgi:hypothetical protein
MIQGTPFTRIEHRGTESRPAGTGLASQAINLGDGVVGAVQHPDPQRLIDLVQPLAGLIFIRPARIGLRPLLVQRGGQVRDTPLGTHRQDSSGDP